VHRSHMPPPVPEVTSGAGHANSALGDPLLGNDGGGICAGAAVTMANGRSGPRAELVAEKKQSADC
jgi:hypothetical protein